MKTARMEVGGWLGRARRNARIAAAAVALLAVASACGPAEIGQSDARVRAARRAFDGAPPVVPHDDFGMTCGECHNARGMPVEDLGFAPASPHDGTTKALSTVRCRQCHVFALDDGLFVMNDFVGFAQDLRQGERLNPLAPPVIPHLTLMRENCQACHTGPGARVAITSVHPERDRCQQCHVATLTSGEFVSAASEGLPLGN